MTGALRVLLIEDSPTDAKLVIRELQRRAGDPIEFERVEDAASMRTALEEKVWDVVISDWSMPKFTASGALGVLKEKNLDLPFIIVSGTIGEDSAVEAMRAGAHDYVLKDKLGRLSAAVDREVGEARLRRELLKRREEDERFFCLALDMLCIAGFDGYFKRLNPAWQAALGWSTEELLAKPWLDFVHPDDVKATIDVGNQLTTSGNEVVGFENRYRCKDGSYRSLLWTAAGMVKEGVIYAAARDISSPKRLEEQLRQSQKMEAIGRLAGGVAHDFNNVLSVILSYGELVLADLKPDEPMHKDVEEIRKAAMRAAGLTRQLLMFSHQQVIEPKVVDLNDVLTSMDQMLQRILGADVDLVSLPTQPLGRVRVDPSSIEQVIMNLVVNARDAMPRGGKLTMETDDVILDAAYARDHLGAKAGPHVMLAVTDTGAGIDKATLPRIFEPFFTTKGVGKGTGLGLSTVFGIVQQSGGSVWVYSEPGQGTTFKVYLPRVDAAVDGIGSIALAKNLGGTETILLVEDDDQVCAVACNILRKNGYHVIDAHNPAQALLHSEKYPGTIHLLLTDVVMPQLSGPELAKRLASARPDMKVLCMSGYTDDSIVRHGVLETGVAFLQKPVTPALLARKVREVLDPDPVRYKESGIVK